MAAGGAVLALGGALFTTGGAELTTGGAADATMGGPATLAATADNTNVLTNDVFIHIFVISVLGGAGHHSSAKHLCLSPLPLARAQQMADEGRQE